MFVQGSFPNLIDTTLSFGRDHGQLNMDLDCGETWRKSPQCEECRGAVCTGEEESKVSSTSIGELSRTCSDLSPANNTYASYSSERDDYVFKRRKLQRNTIALVPEENVIESAKRNSDYHSILGYVGDLFTVSHEDLGRDPTFVVSDSTLDNGDPSVSEWQHLQKFSNVPSLQSNHISNLELVPHIVPDNRGFIREEVPVVSSVSILREYASGHNSGTKDICSSSQSSSEHVSTLLKTEVEDSGECSSSDIISEEPLEEFTSAKEMCISVLKRHGLLGGLLTNRSCVSSEVPGVTDANCSRLCKVCGRLENTMKMLICDLCEEAFHVSCCNPRIEKVPVDEWCCQPCFRKKPKRVVKNNTTKSSNIVEHRKNMSDGGLNPILVMLRDNQPYTTGVRIGKGFQAEVPKWSGPVYNDHNYLGEPAEVDPSKCASLNVWSFNKPSKSSSIGNWVQCQEVNDEGTLCGKWRRAPLFIVQTDKWDCSCAVVWDPFHADCAVPQELETNIVLKHLKYIETLRLRLADNKQADNKQKTNHARGDGPE